MSSGSAHTTNPQKFTRFNELPKELRLTIWEYAIPEPRIVHLQSHHLPVYHTTRVWSNKPVDEFSEDGIPVFFDAEQMGEGERGELSVEYGPGRPRYGFKSPCPSPVLLFVCRESHEVASKFYVKAFGERHAIPETWFDFTRDTLYLDWAEQEYFPGSMLACIPTSDARQIRNFASYDSLEVAWSGWHDGQSYDDYEDWICDVFLTFPRLEKFTVVIGRLHEQKGEAALVFKPPNPAATSPFQYDLPSGSHYNLNKSMQHYREFMLIDKPFVDLEKLAVYRQWCLERGLDDWTVPPIIDCQIVTTPNMKSLLETQELAFGLEIQE